jgi:hypothetical protein
MYNRADFFPSSATVTIGGVATGASAATTAGNGNNGTADNPTSIGDLTTAAGTAPGGGSTTAVLLRQLAQIVLQLW